MGLVASCRHARLGLGVRGGAGAGGHRGGQVEEVQAGRGGGGGGRRGVAYGRRSGGILSGRSPLAVREVLHAQVIIRVLHS